MEDRPYASRGGQKLAAALREFHIDPTGWTCADLGCSVGGFTDCLLRHGAAQVYAVDTAYGQLAWRLRRDPRVQVLERTNALHVELPEPVSLISIDVGWTRQQRILPIARRLLGLGGQIITLVKPHYEAEPSQLQSGVLPDEDVRPVVEQVVARLAESGIVVEKLVASPIRGQGGNREMLGLIRGPA